METGLCKSSQCKDRIHRESRSINAIGEPMSLNSNPGSAIPRPRAPFWGIDGCRGGWLVVECDTDRRFCAPARVCRTIGELTDCLPGVPLALIDIPIGLTDYPGGVRKCDEVAREMLGPRRSSVFYPVVRQALSARTYAEACAVQKALCGKKPSIQSWNITPRIREVEAFLQQRPGWRKHLRESHPELCFRELNGGLPLPESKRTPEGLQHRLSLLAHCSKNARSFFEQTRATHPRNQVADDDIVDAMVLALHAAMSRSCGLVSIPDPAEFNRAGEMMEIVFADISFSQRCKPRTD